MTTELVPPLDQVADLPQPLRPHRLRVTHPAPEVDLEAARDAARDRVEEPPAYRVGQDRHCSDLVHRASS